MLERSVFVVALTFIAAFFQGQVNCHVPVDEGFKGIEEDILRGIDEISVSGAPGFLTIYGNSTTSILAGERWDWEPDVFHSMIAANSLGQGRIIGCSHTSLLSPILEANPEQPGEIGHNLFILNSARWASGDKELPNVLIIIGDGNRDLATFLNISGISSKQILPRDLTSIQDLIGFDVVLSLHPLESLAQAGILIQYVEEMGGGIVFALTAWAYTQYTDAPGHFGHTFPLNTVSSRAGFVWRNGWGDGYGEPTTPSGNFNVSREFVKNTNTARAWPEIYNVLSGGQGSPEFQLNPNQFISIVEMDLKAIPPQDPEFFQGENYREMREFALDLARQPVPRPGNPITDETQKLVAHVFNLLGDLVLEPEEIGIHPASYYFPGNVTASIQDQAQAHEIQVKFKRAAGVDATMGWENTCHLTDDVELQKPTRPFQTVADDDVEVNNRHALWFTTGLYAPAGSLIQISIVGFENVNNTYGVQIGCHTDDISRHDAWPRLPIITKRVPIVNGEAKMASHFGGLLYITRPAIVEDAEEVITVRVVGAVPAPVFKLGQTSLKKWREDIRFIGAPWAEFESEKIILSLEAESAKEIEDPESLLVFWDLVMDAISELTQSPMERGRQERMVPDALISAGFMHAGYPIMTFLPEGKWAVNLTRMRAEGSWGHFHELGHNHQQSAWTFSGTGEVTNNLFALYLFNSVLGLPASAGHEMMTPVKYIPLIQDYIQTGKEFSKWQSSAFLALMIYHQLQMEYGWSAYKSVFERYNGLSSGELPGSDQEKIDLWLVTFSQVVEENLGPLFASWGIPFTAEALEKIKHLPEAPLRIEDMLG